MPTLRSNPTASLELLWMVCRAVEACSATGGRTGRKPYTIADQFRNIEQAIIFVYMYGNDSLDAICVEWSYMRVYAVANMMQDQIFPDSKSEPAKPKGFQSGTTNERRGDRNIKTTKMSWVDMAKKAKAGVDTSIKAV